MEKRLKAQLIEMIKTFLSQIISIICFKETSFCIEESEFKSIFSTTDYTSSTFKCLKRFKSERMTFIIFFEKLFHE